ncbi:MAG TPA: DMT family transporter [Gemmatimonadaceae bacterium]|nr:DMT family transporter [Gemmatimonadaceae bacterium]
MTARPALPQGKATLAVIAAAFGFSSISIATVIGTRDGTPLSAVVIGRFLLAGLLLVPIAGGWRGLRLPRPHVQRLVVQGGAGQAAVNLLNLSALAYMPAATVVFLFYTYPAWVTVISAIRGTDRVGPRRLFALALSLAGIVVIIGAPGAGAFSPVGAALSLSGAFVYGLYFPLLRRLQLGTTATVATFYIAVGTCLSLLLYAAVRGELAWTPTPGSVGAMAWLAVVPTVIAFQLILRGLESLGAVRTAIISTAEPFCAAVLGALVLDQPVTLPAMAGGALIALAVLILQRPEPIPVDAVGGAPGA